MLRLLLPLASLLGIEVDELVDRLRKDAIALAAMALFCLIAGIFLLVALHAAMVAWLGPIWGPLAIAGGALVIAGVIFITIKLIDNAAKRRAQARRHATDRTALVTTAAITALPMLMGSDLMKKVGLPLGGALAAAFLLSRSGGHSDDEA